MNLEHYSTFTTEDLILDNEFRVFVLRSSDTELMGLFEFLSDEKKNNVYLASRIIRNLQVQKLTDSDENKNLIWKKILNQK